MVIGLLLVVSCGELGLNGLMLFEKADRHSVTEYADYVSQMEDQIAAVKELDTGTYRISETSVRRVKEDGLMANFNEPLCYNYWSITGYTSSPDDIQREFLQRAGYTESGENMCIVMDSVLGTDSLLGVKYVLSKFEINGLQRVEEIPVYNGKYTYENPYALPMALLYERDLGADTEDDTNPFVYQNSLYSELLGREVELYKPVPYVIVQEGDVESGSSLQFALQIPEGNYAIYGNIPWYHYNYTKATIDVNGSYLLAYAQWTSPSVFHIPAQPGSVATIEYSSQTSYDIPMEEVQFYALDLDLLGAVTEEISANVPDASSIQNGRISITVKDAGEGQNLFLSVPADDGWTITDNGENVETELVGECLYSIPLAEGANQIEMRYHIPWLTPGILVSVIGVLCVLLFGKLEKKWENRQ